MKKCITSKLFVLPFLLFFPRGLYAQESIGVLDISPMQGVSAVEAAVVTEFVYDALYRFGGNTYNIISRQNREAILAEHKFVLSGLCDDTACAVEIGRYLAADYVVIGSFTTFGSKYYLSLQLVNVNTTTVAGSAREGAADLDGIAETAVDVCVAGIFGAAVTPGGTVVPPAPVTADVVIRSNVMAYLYFDGKYIGRTPATVTKVTDGWHDYRLTAEGYTEKAERIFVYQGEDTVRDVVLE